MGEGQGRAGRTGRAGAGRGNAKGGEGGGGGAGGWLFEPTFNRAIKLLPADPRITSDAGALLLREADYRLGLTADLVAQLTDERDPQRVRYTQVELLRQHLYALALDYAHQDDQDILAHDVALKLSVWDRPGRQGLHERLASRPSDQRLIDRLASPSNRRALRAALSEWVARHQRATGAGVPLALAVDGANRHDRKLVGRTLNNLAVPRPARRKQNMCMDKGYDYPGVRERVARWGYTAHIVPAARSAAPGGVSAALAPADGWSSEGTPWLNRFRGLLIRWEKKVVNHTAMLHMACAYIALRVAEVMG
jgi:putative transposase